MALTLPFLNSYARLPGQFYTRLDPTPVKAPRLLKLNVPLAQELGLDAAALASEDGVQMLAGNLVPEGAEPIAQAYAGHQFGGFTPQLGDGRAILLGEVIAQDGTPRDIQLKGSGPTPWSRRGDGRAAVGPVLREYLVSEAMHALGIPTTRSLAAVATGEWIFREVAVPGAVLTRVASSHLRVGTFQYFAARGDVEAVRTLVDWALARHYPGAEGARGLLQGVVSRQAQLVAQWMLVGFIHGVMNTDNTTISGETIDYGPCAFMDAYHPGTVFSSIDHGGRYAFGNQPRILHWNLARLAETLLPLLDADENAAVEQAQDILSGFAEAFNTAWLGGLGHKLGLAERREGDSALASDLLKIMAEGQADFTQAFRALGEAVEGRDAPLRALFLPVPALEEWLPRWHARLAEEPMPPAARRAAMDAVNPVVIPRNHLVEDALDAATQREDMAPFEALLAVVQRPFEVPADARYARPLPGGNPGYQTFCGT